MARKNTLMTGIFVTTTLPLLFLFQSCAGNYHLTTSASGAVAQDTTTTNGQFVCIPGTDTNCPVPSPTPDVSPTPGSSPSPNPSQSPSGGDGPGTCTVTTNTGGEREVGFDHVTDGDFDRENCHGNSQNHQSEQSSGSTTRQLVPKACQTDGGHHDSDDGDDDVCMTQHGCDLINGYMQDTDGVLMGKPHHVPGTDNGNGNGGQDDGWHCAINGNCLHQYTHFHPGCDCKNHKVLTDQEVQDAINQLQGYWSNH